MKRLFAIVVLLMCVGFVGSVSAQDLQKNIVGVRAGVNISNMGIKVLMFNANMSSKLGYNAGVSYSKGRTRVALGYGRYKDGFICSGGVCRIIPQYTGANFSITTSF